MRNVRTILFILALFVHAAKADCVITFTLDISGENQDFTIKIKGGQSRVDCTGLSFLFDSKSDKMTLLNHLNKTYSKLTGESIKAWGLGQAIMGGADKNRVLETTDLKPTGRTETINGYKTEEFIGSSGGIRLRFFVDKDFPTAKYDVHQALSCPVFDAFKGVGSIADKCPGMPIRMVYDAPVLMFTFTLESISEASLEDGDFQIPADYREET